MFSDQLIKQAPRTLAACMSLALCLGAPAALADSPAPAGGVEMHYRDGKVHNGPRADGHAPIGVMGDHRHHKGDVMLSFRYMRMWMEGNQIGDDDVSPETIATTVPNRFFGTPGQPPTLRVVPTKMSMDMFMFGGMYGLTDRVTLMAMVPYIVKEMDHITFAGAAGTNRRGVFTTKSEGIGDLSATAMIGLFDQKTPTTERHLNLLLGMSAPTGSIEKEDIVLAPNGAMPNLRLPYAMQIGSGTWDFKPGITYTDRRGDFSWGSQYKATIRLGENDEGYAHGDIHETTSWMQYQWRQGMSTSLRVAGRTQGSIDGIDTRIVAPVQTADPNNFGGERVDILVGMNLVGQQGDLCGHRAAIEFGVPVYQNLNGPQMETDWTLTFGWQKALGDC